jgi:GTP:adenosylcobinamide-phosphate guanylyltransferase
VCLLARRFSRDDTGRVRTGCTQGYRGDERLSIEMLDESAWKRFDSDNRLFWNMNALEDYREARRILETEER